VSNRKTGAENGKKATVRGDVSPAAGEGKPLKGTKCVAGRGIVSDSYPGLLGGLSVSMLQNAADPVRLGLQHTWSLCLE
jgi:hypothetical protein